MKDTRMYLRGTEKDCKDFTINLTWFHFAAGEIGSVVRNDELKTVTLNLIVDGERVDDVRRWATKFNLVEMKF